MNRPYFPAGRKPSSTPESFDQHNAAANVAPSHALHGNASRTDLAGPGKPFETAEAVTTAECDECEGRGSWLESVRFTGEAYGCQSEVTCHACDGEGKIEIDPECPGCEAAIRNGICADCRLVFLDAAALHEQAMASREAY